RWRRLDGSGAVYVCECDGKTFARMGYTWSKVLHLAGLDDRDGKVTPHIMRHTRATWLMQAGMGGGRAFGHERANARAQLWPPSSSVPRPRRRSVGYLDR